MQLYEVTFEHKALTGPLVVELRATTPERAELRVRYYAFHEYRTAEFLDEGTCAVVEVTAARRAGER